MNKVSGIFLKKYINSPKKEWKRFDSIFMVLGIIISVAVLTVAIAIFEGYENVLKKTILGVNSHIYVFKPGEENLKSEHIEQVSEFLKRQPEVESYAKIIMTQAMASYNNRVVGCLIRGIEWEIKNQPTSYKKYVFSGSYELQNSYDIVLGYRLAKKLNVGLGDTLKLISPMNSKVTPMGIKPKQQVFTVVGLYKSGMYEYDSKFTFVNLQSAAEFIAINDEYSMLEVKLKEEYIEKADYLAYKWEMMFIQEDFFYQISSWIDFNGNLFSLLKLQKWVMFIILSFLVLIASFNVVSSVSTSIIEKRKELGILKAYGASNTLLQKIFIGKTLLISFIAVTIGQILGVVISVFLSKQTFFLLKADVYFLEKINVDFNLFTWITILVVSIFIVFFASLVPLRKIAQLQITSILRNE